jgi:hypothetical protein
MMDALFSVLVGLAVLVDLTALISVGLTEPRPHMERPAPGGRGCDRDQKALRGRREARLCVKSVRRASPREICRMLPPALPLGPINALTRSEIDRASVPNC